MKQCCCFLVILVLVQTIDASTECDNAIDLDRKEGPFQDSTINPAWYKVKHYELTDEAEDYQECGTTYPVWGRGDFPDDGQETEIDACVVTQSNNCNSTWKIRVKDCGKYDIYYLKPTQTNDQAYCFKLDDDDDDCEKERHHGKKFHRCHRNHRRALLIIGITVIVCLIASIVAIYLWRRNRCAAMKRKEAYKEKQKKETPQTGPVVSVTNENLPPKY